ncbi:MAG: VIT domain-containing protein [Planctomycetota bacterium]
MSDERTHDDDDSRLKAALRAVEADAPLPDAALLDALRQRAAEAFATGTTTTQSQPLPAQTAANSKRRHPMVTLAIRGLWVASAAAAMLVAWLVPIHEGGVSNAAPFSKVIDELRGASSLHLQVVRDGRTAEVWVRAPGLVRKEESPQRYEIAAGSRLWRVDEETNTATETDSPWFSAPDRQVDLVALLDVGVRDATALLNSRPRERSQFDGRECFVYRAQVEAASERIELEGFVDVQNQQLAGIRAKRGPNILLAEMRLIAMNEAVADEKFVVAKSLTEDGRIGKVSDAQGIAVIRPMLAKRWTPLGRDLLLKPGDWLRTELRGANALKVTLSSDVELTLGPGSLVECISPTQARLHSGEVQVMSPEKKTVEENVPFILLAPREGKRVFKHGDKQLVRVDRDEKLVDVPQTPVWLAGFEGTSNNESLGSLIVKLPDGRNEPLTVGYHKVSVEIRDQIARTTIEESFVNHTAGRLEGIFHFPLPQDASISGFGMWIGNDLVEADVVEKQRAREIYETILRDKRDPGLLEWTAGNLFKARVFPIEAFSEKRVKIVYTQVLPLRANRYRYSYGLRSDLLRTKPLRELSLTVTVNSALPLKAVTCPTHTVRTQQTEHSAQVEFAAQEYSPNRDFEVVCEIDAKQSDVVVIPHRRGADGYLLVQLTPPGAEGNWQRELLPDGKPLNVVLLCDSSASMDSEKRKQQAEFVATVLSSLGADDRFLLAAADVGTEWAFAEPAAPSAENIAKANNFLDQRASLGWTNLDRAFAEVIKKAPADAQVIYVGDGIVSAGDTDPARFVKRLGQLLGEKVTRTFHAVTVGNITESVVLKGIATVGGGSVRSIGGEQTSLVVAKELLNEIAQPGLRDVNVEFKGVKVAAVYPERLPNVAAGTQQILVGRYLPEGKDQVGEIIVTGKRGGESVRYAARINFKDAEAEEGNSFIPRLWARGHLDHLLAQGQAAAVKDDIIGLSEQFHIITPYTSLLVLETDADRERFGVKRRYEMRDGERFFAEGRNNANFELVQQQMKRAGDWRLGIRRQVLRSLAGLGRNPQMFQQQVQVLNEMARVSGGGGYLGDYNGPVSYSGAAPASGPMGGSYWGFAGRAGGGGNGRFDVDDEFEGSLMDRAKGMLFLGDGLVDLLDREEQAAVSDSRDKPARLSVDALGDSDSDGLSLGFGEDDRKELGGRLSRSMEDSVELLSDFDEAGQPGQERGGELPWYKNGFDGGEMLTKSVSDRSDFRRSGLRGLEAKNEMFSLGAALGAKRKMASKSAMGRYYQSYQPDYTSWLSNLFPALPARPGKAAPALPDPEGWSPQALALSRSLLRVDALSKLPGGLELKRTVDSFDPRWKRQSAKNTDLVLYSPTGWLTRTLDLDEQTIVNYATAQERGVFSLALLLGRVRSSAESERHPSVLGLNDSSITALHEAYRGYQAKLEAAGENRVTLILKPKNSVYEQHLLIDTARHVILKNETFDDGKLIGATTFDDFVEVAGTWLARKLTVTDDKGRKTNETTLDVKVLTAEEHAARMTAQLAAKTYVQFLRLPYSKLSVARQKVADGAAGFDDRITMILHYASLQQWDELLKQVDAAEALVQMLAVGKPGVPWIRTAALVAMRRNEEARQRFLAEAKQLAAAKTRDEVYLADFIHGQAAQVGTGSEMLDLVNLLKPVYERQAAELDVMVRWQEKLLSSLDSLGRSEEALALRKSMVEKAPWHVHWQQDVALRMRNAGQYDAAEKWLRNEIARDIERPDYEDETLRGSLTDLFRTRGQWDRLLAFTTDWIAKNPESSSWNSAYAQHVSALVYNDKLDAANAIVEQWLKEARVEGKLTPAQRARLETAINFAQGNAYNISFQRADERWFGILAETARFFVRHKHHGDIAHRIFNHHYFQQSEDCDRLRGEFLNVLRTDLANLTPAQLSFLVNGAIAGRLELVEPINDRKQLQAHEVPLDIWKKIAAELRARWTKTEDRNDRDSLGTTLSTIYGNRFYETEVLPFLRARIATAPADLKPGYYDLLFNDLLARPWTDELEQEAFQTLRLLSRANEPDATLSVQLPALHRLVDAMLANRAARDEKLLRDAGEVNKLTRTELAKKRAETRKASRAAFALRLTAEADKEEMAKGQLAAWLRMEQMWLDVQLDQNLDKVEERCWAILGEVPPKPEAVEEEDDDDVEEPAVAGAERMKEAIDGLLKQRAFVTVMNLAARRKAAPATIDRVLKFIDAGIAHGGDVARAWKSTKFQMLVALDRPDDLERDLRTWIREDQSTSPWRQSLARLLAERGKLDEAIQLFESAEKDKLLSAGDYRMLSDWYLVTNRRSDHERAKLEVFKQMPEGNLGNSLYGVRNRWYQHNVTLPSELDENTLLTFRALFAKSANPENYLWQLREIYAASRDFRLLQMLPDAVLGRSPQQVYAYLQNLNSQVLVELRNEATADEILSRVKSLREGERTPTDLRALDLLEALVERKSSEVLNQPGPHVKACVAALRRAFARDWQPGEPRLMSGFLYSLGGITNGEIAAEQLRELRALQAQAPAASRDHLFITNDLCNLLGGSYSKRDEAIAMMEIEVRDYALTNGGQWPHEDNGILGSFVSLYEGGNKHAAGEAVLLKWIDQTKHDEQRKWLRDRLMSLYNNALEHKGEVTLGGGEKLFNRIIDLGLKEIDAAPDEHVRYNVVARMCTTFDIAQRNKIGDHPGRLAKFVFESLPKILKQQQSQYRNTVQAPLHVTGTSLSPKLALQYVVERLEQYPQRFEVQWDNGWQSLGYELARRREVAAAELGDLAPRVLALAIRELKRDLRTGESRNYHIYYKHHGHFWAEKAPDFAKAANEVHAERKNSGRRVRYIANYLRNGLELRARAIEILMIAHGSGLLDESEQAELVGFLQNENRYAESIPLLEGLVKAQPDSMTYRTQLMAAYHHSQRPEQLATLVKQIDTHFHADGRWTEGNIAQFGKVCLGCNLNELSVGYLSEAISLHQRDHGGRTLNDAALSDYYQHLAGAQSRLGRTKEAVDAASAAIVCWGPRHDQRQHVMRTLNQTLSDAKDLDDYVKHLDAEAAKTGQDSPILRKTIGQVYQAKGNLPKATTQYELALALQPLDKEVHQALIVCYDGSQQPDKATRQLMALIDFDRHDLKLFTQLADRLKANEAEAERAATSIIEAAPNEAENHAAMADLRQQQNRWDEAIPHWEQVAELRRLEPNGLLKLATAQVHQKQWEAARTTINKLNKTEWPSRFTNVQNETRQLQEKLPK